MRKLSTILFTILLFFITITQVNATSCAPSQMLSQDFTVQGYDLTYRYNNGLSGQSGASNGNAITINNLYGYGDLKQRFQLTNNLFEYVRLHGIISITNTTPNSFDTYTFLKNIPAPTLIYNESGTELDFGSCTYNYLVLDSDFNRGVDTNTGSNMFLTQTISWDVTCYVGGNGRNINEIKGIHFNLSANQLADNVSLNSNIEFKSYLSNSYQTWTSEYDFEFCQLQNAIENISTNSNNVASSTDIQNQTQQIINNNNQNTQDIIDNQNDIYLNEQCTTTTCSNIFHPSNPTCVGINSCSVGDSFIKGNFSSSFNFITFSNSVGTIESGKTYHYTIECSENITAVRFNTNLSYTSDLSCGTGTFTTSTTYNIDSMRIYTSSSVSNGEVKVYISEQEGDYCAYGSTVEQCTGFNRLDNINNSITDVNNTLNDSNTDGAASQFQDIIDDFNFNDHGLTSFLLIPVNAAQNLLSATCTPVHLQFPYLNNKSVDLPCYSPLFDNNFSTLMILIRICTNGIIAYYCVMQIYKMMINLSNPDHANIEVFEL